MTNADTSVPLPFARAGLLFAGVSFLAAFLLFQLQLILGKTLLPWYGGVPAVWTTCMVFFQALLLMGYGWAHGLARLGPRRQLVLHGVVVGTSLVLLGWAAVSWGTPLLPPDTFAPDAGSAPQAQLVWTLLVSCALPFLVLAAASPLLQRWWADRFPGQPPWRLYAWSNAGSLLGLVSYPLLIEPLLTLSTQAWVWTTGFLGFVIGLLILRPRFKPGTPSERGVAPRPARPHFGQVLAWVGLSGMAVAMMLAVTQELTAEVAVVPLLWVLPLALYLLTFIVSFNRPDHYRRNLLLVAALLASFVLLVTAYLGVRLLVPWHVLFSSLFLYLFCRVCHAELVRLRPDPGHLTFFYLMISTGGVLGGLGISLVLPSIFRGQWDLSLCLIAGWVLIGGVLWRDRQSVWYQGDRLFPVLLGFVGGYMVSRLLISWAEVFAPWRSMVLWLGILGGLVAAGVVGWFTRGRRRGGWSGWPRIALGGFIFFAEIFLVVDMRSQADGSVYMNRNFFGSLTVRFSRYYRGAPVPNVQLVHGAILHGMQMAEEGKTRVPSTYYGVESGMAKAVERLREHHGARPLHIGVMGMGAGTMSLFGRAQDRVTFYEINPLVVEVAASPGARFTMVSGSEAAIDFQVGDARLLLEQELSRGISGRFDLLVMDAFTSDSVPAHLLTTEAFDVYAAHLRGPDAVLAVNISNRFLDLRGRLLEEAERRGWEIVVCLSPGSAVQGTSPALWVLLSREEGFAADPRWEAVRQPLDDVPLVLWTDQYSSLLPLLKW